MSKLALELIEKEKQERTGVLDLGNCELTELPEELFELVWLERLYLSENIYDWQERQWVLSKNKGKTNQFTKLQKNLSQLTTVR